MSPSPNNRDDLILQRLDQIHTEITDMRSGLREDLKDYVLTVVYDKENKRLDEKDNDQEDHLQRLEDRVLTQGQRWLTYMGAIVGVLGGALGIIHLFIGR